MKKKKFRVYATVTGSKYLGVFEGTNKDEAIEEALDQEGYGINLCHQCSTECEDGQLSDLQAEECDGSEDTDE